MALTPLFGTNDCTTATAASGTAMACNKPTNTADNDYLVAFAYNQSSGGSLTAPAGWTSAGVTSARSAGTYWKKITSAVGEPSSYTWTASAGARWAVIIFRVTGADPTTVLDVVGVEATISGGSVNLPSVSPTHADSVLFGFCYSNNSSTTQSTVGVPGTMTDGKQLPTPATTNTSTIDVAYQQLSTSGATGTRTFTTSPAAATMGGWMVALAALPVQTASVALAVTTNLSVVVPGAKTASVPLAVATSLAVTPATPVQAWLRDTIPMAAHRGGSADWPEETLYAYGQAAAWSPRLALEISVWQSSDGVWVCSHDQTTGRVFGTSYDIPTTPWATLQSLRTTVGNQPIARLDDVLNAYATGNRVLFIDDKGNQSIAALFTLLDTYGGNTRFVIKSFQSGTSIAAQAHTRGYLTWGYYYEADVPSLPSTQASWDLLGMDYTASSAAWASVLSYGKPVLGHIIPDAAGKTTALSKGATGLMVSGVVEAVPQVGAGAMIPLAVTTSLGVGPARTATSPVALAVRTVLAVAGSGGTILVRDITVRPGPVVTRYAAGPAVT